MDTSKLKKFASFARQALIEQIGAKLAVVLAEGSLARRESQGAVAELEAIVAADGQKQTIETVAYTWFNRFCALRYMDVNRYTKIGVLSPAEGQFLPEILAEAKRGYVDEEIVPAATRAKVVRLLDGTDPSPDPQGEAYRLLLVAACNHYQPVMPFMFERIADYTELLLPNDLLSGTAVPTYTREALLPANCSPEFTEESVEVIGWLYQFYIADKKDDVFAALKKGKKITPANIPAATQLFTPHWIVRYLVENSLGRLWMLNHPDSRLVERMEYYIRPEEPETDFLKISSPEEIKICDPACGSGHMLTYAFDLLYAIYEEQGYQATEIPRLILTHNLYGVEIDQRAGALAAFALTMKAREKYKRFLSKGKHVEPNICVLESIQINPEDLSEYMDKVGRDLFSQGLQGVVNQWEEADNFGSLIRPLVTDVSEVLELLRERQLGEDLFLAGVHQKVLKALRQADYLSPKYHVVVANPPYMGSKGMNASLKDFAKDRYSENKSDLFAMFIERNIELARELGAVGMITMQSWMFLSSYDGMRSELLENHWLHSLAHFGSRAFDTIGGEVVSTVAFVLSTQHKANDNGTFIRLVDFDNEAGKQSALIAALDGNPNDLVFRFPPKAMLKIPGAPIAYWVSECVRQCFVGSTTIGDIGFSDGKNVTGDNNRFQRFFWEVPSQSVSSKGRWLFISKGGGVKKWSETKDITIDWSDSAREFYRSSSVGRLIGEYLWNRDGITWGLITTTFPSFRMLTESFTFSDLGLFFEDERSIAPTLGLLNSSVARMFLNLLNPTLNFPMEVVLKLPISNNTDAQRVSDLVSTIQTLNSSPSIVLENSWEFSISPLISGTTSKDLIDTRYSDVRRRWRGITNEVNSLEATINEIHVQSYGLTAEVSSDAPLEETTLMCNPVYRYGSDKSESELEALLLADTMREFISYAVGCMLGRYSLDKPGLILANQGETADDYRQQIPEPTFAPDEDNVIPLLDGDWFEDDFTERFKAFLKVTFGTEHYEENLTFLENALYPDNLTGKKRKTIRDYFLKEFYNHHIKLYKKRPIYWLFSSPKGTFNALIYMHRYRPDTVSTVLQYLRDFRDKLSHRADHAQMLADSGGATAAEKTRGLKEVAAIRKQLKELEAYERDTLFPLAQAKIEIDLDDGVKHNYPLFGQALKKVPGLSS